MSSGPPATPSRLPLRSASVLIGELGGTMMAPSAVVKGEKVKSAPPAPLARDPQPVGGDDVDRAALQADGGRLGARERRHVELDAFGLVEAVGANGVEHPTDRAEFENADLNLVRRVRGLARRQAIATAQTSKANRHDRNGRSSTLLFSNPMALGLTRRDARQALCRGAADAGRGPLARPGKVMAHHRREWRRILYRSRLT